MIDVELADYTKAGRLQALSDTLRVIQPSCDVRHIGRAAGRIASTAVRARDVASRFRPPEEALELAFKLMRGAECGTGFSELERALLFRDGLIIGLWVCRALRIANLASIEVGRQLQQGRGGYRLSFDASEMKGKRHYTCSWPGALSDALVRYLDHYRPRLLSRGSVGRDEAGLWPSHKGEPMTSGSIGQIIQQRTESAFGAPLNPHIMRYIVASAVAERRPDLITDAAAMLGHASLETTERHYIMANTLQAATTFQDVMTARLKPRRPSDR